ncbi:MAG: arginine deiminase [Acholeplasmataceae bacterium]
MIAVRSEIGRLRSVLVHRPGKELENLTPDLLEKLLFDDIPYLRVAQREHDDFVRTLREQGVEVLYLTDMLTEALDAHPEVKDAFLTTFIAESMIKSETIRETLERYLKRLDTSDMVHKLIEGVRKNDVDLRKSNSIIDMLEDEYPFLMDPLPNLFFQRDPFASVGKGAVIGRMSTDARRRETLFSEYVLTYHPRFAGKPIPFYYDRRERYDFEGGDFLVLSEHVLAIGISKRTDPRAIERIARKIFASDETFRTVLAFNIPKMRAFMHLDTVFTQVDRGVFTIHPGIEQTLTVFEITKGEDLRITKVVDTLEKVLEKHLKTPIELIRCGGNDVITSVREQWNDGANTLAIAPGKVVVYDRNHVTNGLLRAAGIDVLEIGSSELSRGRGGPRCMTMPLERENT